MHCDSWPRLPSKIRICATGQIDLPLKWRYAKLSIFLLPFFMIPKNWKGNPYNHRVFPSKNDTMQKKTIAFNRSRWDLFKKVYRFDEISFGGFSFSEHTLQSENFCQKNYTKITQKLPKNVTNPQKSWGFEGLIFLIWYIFFTSRRWKKSTLNL